MYVVSVVGARPQFVKLGPVAKEMAAAGVRHEIIHTGQHYDLDMSDSFFRDLGIPNPDYNLGVGSGTHGAQTGRMLETIEDVLSKNSPDWLLVYGDTNSTLAAAIAGVKLRVPVAHLEAGLRSFNRAMPEEHNRVLTDHAADLCLAPTTVAASHLEAEGLQHRTVITGDVMTDVCLLVSEKVKGRPLPTSVPFKEGQYVLATLHRAENVDDGAVLTKIAESLEEIDYPVVLPVHPRLLARCQSMGIDLAGRGIHTTSPMNYPDLIRTVLSARAVITDSGGLQKEAFLLRTPCVTLRAETEWVETVELGWNTLCPQGENLSAVLDSLHPRDTRATPYGSGNAASVVVETLQKWKTNSNQ